MYPKKPVEIQEKMTSIWSCSDEHCPGWMRDNFSFQKNPKCPLCSSSMINEERMLPVLTNNAL